MFEGDSSSNDFKEFKKIYLEKVNNQPICNEVYTSSTNILIQKVANKFKCLTLDVSYMELK